MCRCSDEWLAKPVDDRLSLGQWLSTPSKLVRHVISRWDVHTLYLPRATLDRVKEAAAQGAPSAWGVCWASHAACVKGGSMNGWAGGRC